jgi:anti-sigma regulatory factor (Ser/Thr protein kinase)
MCRRALLGLEPTPQAVGEARRFVADTCHRWDIDGVTDELTLAVSELVTNAVLHARTEVDVELCVSGGAVTVSVIDRDPRPPVVRPVRLDLLADLDAAGRDAADRGAADRGAADRGAAGRDEGPFGAPDLDDRNPTSYVGSSGSVAGGRGLLIVDALADEWGVAERADGKEVWLTMPLQWAHEQECVCDQHRSARPGQGRVHMAGPWDLEPVSRAHEAGHAHEPGHAQ